MTATGPTRSVALVGTVLAVGVIVASASLLRDGVSNDRAPFSATTIKGPNAEFSFGSLQSDATQRKVATARHNLVATCMAARGFTETPSDEPATPAEEKYAVEYALADIGDDITTDKLPPPRAVTLPDGTQFEVTATWTPKTCTYQAYDALGGDPFLREALRQQIMIYQAEAAPVIETELSSQVDAWADCVGNPDVTSADLLRAIDGATARSDLSQEAAEACISDEMRAQALEARSVAEFAVANQHHEIVSAWADLLEREALAVDALPRQD